MAAAAGWIDQAKAFQSELFQCWCHGSVEDEIDNEVRRLHERITLASSFRNVLVEIAQKAGVVNCSCEVVDEIAILACALEEVDNGTCAVAGGRQTKQRVVSAIKKAADAGQSSDFVEAEQEVIAIGFVEAGAVGSEVLILCQTQTLAGAGDPGQVDQLVIFEKADEDAGKKPGDGGLSDFVVAPRRERETRALGSFGGFVAAL